MKTTENNTSVTAAPTRPFAGARGEWQQFRVLLRHFVVRLFNNDVMKYEDQNREVLVVFLAFLVMAGALIPTILLFPYLRAMPGYTLETVWREKTLFMTLSMTVTGIIAVLNWDNMFLDDKDFSGLFNLPVSRNTIFSAKFFSLLVFVGIVTASFNFFAVFIFTFYLGHIPAEYSFLEINILRFGTAQFVSSFMANLFVLLAVTLVQSLLMLLLRGKPYKRVSVLVQTTLLFGFVSVLAWYPKIHGSLQSLKDNYSSFVYYFPPLWFTGFHEQLIGNTEYLFRRHVVIAAVVLTVLLDLYVLSFPLNFRRYTDAWNQSPAKSKKAALKVASLSRGGSRGKGLKLRFSEFFQRVVVPHPIQRAIFYFSLAALRRSRKHKFLLAVYIALPTAFLVTELVVSMIKKGPGVLSVPSPFLIAVPLVIYLFLVLGLRMTVSRPITRGANWVFRLAEQNEPGHYISGLKKALFVFALLPGFVVFLLFYGYCWGFTAGLVHGLFCLTVALLLMEISFYHYRKIPFVSAHVPGKGNLKAFWALYVAGFVAYVWALTRLGGYLLDHPARGLYFYAAAAVLVGLNRWYHSWKFKPHRGFRFVYDEDPEQVMLSLEL